ncbi:hypothetical protein M3Y97_00126400 [Aphelenchoides bicaudatus]|nr:hypothetical protein M3Y97_00126400 [Aphelenchoides bicaudatus]
MRLLILTVSLVIGVVIGRPQPGPLGFAPQTPPLIPPGFDEHLPDQAKQRLIQLHFNKDLNFEERRDKIEEVLDGLPKDVLEKLPLPPGLERLPEKSKAKFKELHMNRDISWKERQQLVREAVKELPEDEQRLVEPPRPPMMPPMGPHMGFPPHPPPGFETVLSQTIYKQLMAVHSNPQLSVEEKKQQVDKIMANVPQEQLDRLPLPPGFDRLSFENQQRVRQLMHDFKLDWETRHENVKKFIDNLPRSERKMLIPGPPPGFEIVPKETQDQIDELFMNEKLSPAERSYKIHQLIMQLPEEIRSKLPPPPPMPFQQQ